MPGLGRGLGSLIPAKTNQTHSSAPAIAGGAPVVIDQERVINIDPSQIRANPKQPRRHFSEINLEDLANSIREHGILQPLIVTRQADGYELIAGERRLRAAKKVGLKEVPAIVRRADDQKKLEWALIENIQRHDLNPVELAESYRQLADDFGLSQEELGKRLSKPRSTIANTLRILSLPQSIQVALAEGSISEGHAKILLGLDSEAKQRLMFKKIVANQMSVGEVLQETRRAGGTKQARVASNPADADKELILARFFATKVILKRAKKGGQIVVNFGSDEELGEIMAKLR